MFEEKISDIAICLMDCLPNDWTKVILHGEFDKTHYTFYYYVNIGDDYKQCFNLDSLGINRECVRKCFEKIYDICKNIDKEWNSFDLKINNDGKFSIDYNYDDELQLDKWKAKYLI